MSTQIPLGETMASNGVTYTPANSITVTDAGVYAINFQVNPSIAAAGTVAVSVRQNNTDIPGATVSRALPANIETTISGETVLNLTAGSVIDLAIAAPIVAVVVLGAGLNATLTAKKLN